jgi:hypothetical protein
MSDKSTPFPLKLISSIVSVITFLADLLAIALFIRSVFYGELELTSAVSQILVIVVVFAFATLLWFYSKDDSPAPAIIFSVFSWLYIVFSAAIFVLISQRFMMEGRYTIGEYVGYLFLIFFIGGLGFFIYETNDERTDFFAIPYMLVALVQIIMWIFIIFSENKLEFNWETIGNICLFVIAGMIVLFFINSEKGTTPLLILLGILLVAGYGILGFTVSSLWYIRTLWVIAPIALTILGFFLKEKFS